MTYLVDGTEGWRTDPETLVGKTLRIVSDRRTYEGECMAIIESDLVLSGRILDVGIRIDRIHELEITGDGNDIPN